MDSKVTKCVTGIGGIFFKAEDPQKFRAWYEHHLGIKSHQDKGARFPWRRADDPSRETFTAWSVFPRSTPYFTSKR